MKLKKKNFLSQLTFLSLCVCVYGCVCKCCVCICVLHIIINVYSNSLSGFLYYSYLKFKFNCLRKFKIKFSTNLAQFIIRWKPPKDLKYFKLSDYKFFFLIWALMMRFGRQSIWTYSILYTDASKLTRKISHQVDFY